MASIRTAVRLPAALAATLSLALLGGCSGSDPDAEANGDSAASSASPAVSSSPAAEPYHGYPDSMAVLGHSGATGEGSGGGSLQNNWATGENPEVNSVYLRLLKENEAVEGNASNLAQGGADLGRIYEQALTAVTLDPAPELILVQAIDNDLRCPVEDGDLDAFEMQLTRVLTTLTDGLPNSQVFLTTQDSSTPSAEAAILTTEERARQGGTGPCAIFDPQGRIVPEEIDRLEASIARYADRLATVCERFEQCHHDPAVFQPVDRREQIAPDLNHRSIAGLAIEAEAAWKALRRAGLIPAE
jgi:hypothetical protein